MKNYAIYSFYLAAIVLALLLVLGQLSPIKIGARTLKDIDLFSDLREPESISIDSSLISRVNIQLLDSCKKGMFCIEDYSPNKSGLKRFLNALDSTQQKSIRIGFMGDSFIEGDILTEDVREGLQSQFGGRGVGFVPLTTVLAGARKSSTIYSSGISSHWIVDSAVSRKEAGIAGSYYYPSDSAYASYKGSTFRKHIDTFGMVHVIYQNKVADSKVRYSINRTEKGTFALPKASSVGVEGVKGDIGQVTLSFSGPSLKLFGVLLNDSTGVYVDNFAIRGNAGYAMLKVPQPTLRATDSLLNYRLIVLQSGLNAAVANEKKFTLYKKQMLKMIEHVRASFPNADILLLGVSDRSTMKAGKYVTVESIPYLVSAQREIAAQAKVAFWDTYTAMGGENSMPNFVKAKPSKAAKDYTHLSFEGGKDIGGKLLEAILYEKEKFDEKEKNR